MNSTSDGGNSKTLLLAERLAWTIGVALLAVWGIARLAGHVGSRRELARFEAARSAARTALRLPEDRPDQTLWSPGRVRAWEDSLKREGPAPLAVLTIAKIDLTVPVLEGTDDWTLNRAVGHIEETARPGENGNCGIAGHRDGFFRGLKDVAVGDEMELTTLTGSETYRIETIRVVGQEEVSVLDPTAEPSITLVTCYPFYFVGSAPQRYIVQAAKSPSSRASK